MIALAERHRPSGINTLFPGNPGTFSDYIDYCRNMIAQARHGASVHDMERIVEGNAPFELYPDAAARAGEKVPFRRGIVLVHGLSDSPYFMRHLGAFFQSQGFRVMAVLLPGHGTRSGDLLGARWSEWRKAVAYGVDCLAREAEQVYIGGYSAGGALSVLQALHDMRIRGLFLFAPALKISGKARFANWHRAYSWACPRAKWLSIFPDTDRYKYESFPKYAAAQMYGLTQEVRKALAAASLDLPVFTVASREDVTVDTSATLAFMRGLRNPASRIVYYHDGDSHLAGASLPQNCEAVCCALPEQGILGSAHTAIVIPPEDGHYGATGEYRNCLHYLDEGGARLRECEAVGGANHVRLGEITQANLAGGVVRRLMYNPLYPALEGSMLKFIADLPD